MTMFASFYHSSSSLFSPEVCESSKDSILFSVPPPTTTATTTTSEKACSSCGSKLSSAAFGDFRLNSDEDRIFALQLRAAAVFNKMDVPPPAITTSASTTEQISLNVPPPSLSYPSSHLVPSISPDFNFTRYPPPSTVPSFLNYPPRQDVASSPTIALQADSTTPPTITSSVLCETSSPSGMKRMSDMEAEESPVKRPRPTGDTELRLLIQSKAAGSVIGKGGQNISRLRSENPASITVPDCPGPERVLTIGGSEEVAMKVLEEVLESLDEAMQKDGESDVRVLVHHTQAGCIIGKGGSKIKELREVCGGQVKVYTNCCPQSTDRVIQIIGDRQRVLLTIGSILESLRDSPIKGINNPYNPHNFDEFYAQEYGGWSDGPKGRFPPMGRGPPPMGPGGPIGRGPMGPGPLGPPGPHHPFNRRGHPFPSSRGGSMSHSMHSHNGDYEGGGGMRQGKSFMNGGSPHNDDHSTTTQQVTIPKEAAGAIIGKGGARIRKIRADSGASISIEDSRPGSNDRIITITGSESQIKHAQYLLQQSVREFGGQHMSSSRRF